MMVSVAGVSISIEILPGPFARTLRPWSKLLFGAVTVFALTLWRLRIELVKGYA